MLKWNFAEAQETIAVPQTHKFCVCFLVNATAVAVVFDVKFACARGWQLVRVGGKKIYNLQKFSRVNP